MHELSAALCLVLVIEGLVVFAAPNGWQSMMREALKLDPRRLRQIGAVAMLVGLALLKWLY